MTPHLDIGDTGAIPPRPSPRSFFASKGVFVRDPAGGSGGKGPVEDAAGLAAAAFSWVAFNLADGTLDAYAWESAARRHGLAVVVWGRCHTLEDLRQLDIAAVLIGADAVIVNLEQEGTEPRWHVSADDVLDVFADCGLPLAVSTEPWLPDNFAWDKLDQAGWACLPQAFWNERAALTPPTVVTRARGQFTRVYPTLGVYPVAGRPITPETLASFYKSAVGVSRPFSVYCSDDVPAWEPWGW